MRSRSLPLFALALTALPLAACMCRIKPEPRPAIECRVEPRPPLTAGGPVQIRFALTNPTGEKVWALTWNTPLERWMGTIFTLTGPGGEEIPYQGPMAKRGVPTLDSYVEIPSGETAEAVVDLAQVYEFKNPGLYRLQVTGSLFDLTGDGSELPRSTDLYAPAQLPCNEVVLEVNKPLTP
jgi:peptidyl-Lys metalloendopeptidase